jgi:predicted DNA-binding protein
LYQDAHRPDAAIQQRDYRTYTIRIPLDLADALKREASRRFEPQSVLVRRLVAAGLRSELWTEQ